MIEIMEINRDHTLWLELIGMACQINPKKEQWLTDVMDYHLSDCILIAIEHKKIIGFIRFTVRKIGAEKARPPMIFNNRVLTEAYVETFGVSASERNRGIGRLLQESAMREAQTRSCYQFRSKSAYRSKVNYHLKISLGFTIHPHHKEQSVYFIKAL